MRRRPTRSVLALAAVVAAIVAMSVACVTAIVDPVPSSSPAVPPAASGPADPSAVASLDLSGLDEATATAVRIRLEYGLPSDLDHIRKVAADPTATSEYGTPLLQTEIRELGARGTQADRIIPTIQEYAAGNQAVFGGLWIDQSAGGLVTVSFTDDLERHRVALANLLAGRGIVKVVPARYAESVMRALQDRIAADNAWFKTIPAQLQGVGYDVITNVVFIDLSSANPDIVDLIVARFGVPADAIRVNSDGTGIAMEPWGKIRGRVVDVPARVFTELTLNYHSDRPGASCGMGDVGIGIAANGTFELPCQGGHWTIEAIRTIEDIVARGEVDLEPGGTATVTLRPVAP